MPSRKETAERKGYALTIRIKKMEKLDKKNIEDILKLTPMQEGMLFHYLKNPASNQYFEQLCLDITGQIDIHCFQEAWNFVIDTNQMLRAIFKWKEVKNPIQIILKKHELQPIFYDLSKEELTEKKRCLKTIKDKDRGKEFNLQEVPFRITLCKTTDAKYQMIISNHHLLYDGWSNGIILKEFFKAYSDLSNGKELEKPKKTNFKEFINLTGIGKKKSNQDLNKQEKYWKNYLKGFANQKGSGIEIKKTKKQNRITSSKNYHLQLPKEMKDKLDDFVKRYKVPLSSLLYCAWGILLQKYNSASDVIFDVTVSGRSARIRGIEDIVGLFIKTLPIRIQTPPGARIMDLLTQISRTVQQWDEYENSFPVCLKEQIHTWSNQILFNSVLVLENYPLDKKLLRGNGQLLVKDFEISGMTAYDLTIIITRFDEIKVSFTYNTSCFNEQNAAAVARHFTSIINEIMETPKKKVSNTANVLLKEKNEILQNLVPDRETRLEPGEKYAPPDNKIEEKLVEIWSEILRENKSCIGREANFFEFGGHSLKAAILAGKVHETFNIKVPLAEIFRRPTIKEFAQFIIQSLQNKENCVPVIPIEPAEKKEYYVLSPGQKRLYVFQQIDMERTDYNGVAVLMLEGSLRTDWLRSAFQALIERHEGLRTSFEMIRGEPVQKIHHKVEFEMEYDQAEVKVEVEKNEGTRGLAPLSGKTAAAFISSFIRPFDLSRPPLLRVGLMKIEKNKHIQIADMHHIVTDGISMEILIREFMLLYEDKKLPALNIQHKDYAEWQKQREQNQVIKKQENYWLKVFARKPVILNLPLDFPRPAFQCFEGGAVDFEIGIKKTHALKQMMKSYNTTLYVILLSVYYILLSRYSGQHDIVIGTSAAGRTHPRLQQVIGMFINMLPMRNYPSENKRYSDFLMEVNQNVLAAFENQDYPYDTLARKLNLHGDPAKDPLNIAVFVIHNHRYNGKRHMGNVSITPYRIDRKQTNFDLNLSAVEICNNSSNNVSSINMTLEYAVKLFKPATVRSMTKHYMEILEQVVDNPHMQLKDIKITHCLSTSKSTVIKEDNNDFLF